MDTGYEILTEVSPPDFNKLLKTIISITSIINNIVTA